MSHACLKELAYLVEIYCLSEIIRFESYLDVEITELKQQFYGNTNTVLYPLPTQARVKRSYPLSIMNSS